MTKCTKVSITHRIMLNIKLTGIPYVPLLIRMLDAKTKKIGSFEMYCWRGMITSKWSMISFGCAVIREGCKMLSLQYVSQNCTFSRIEPPTSSMLIRMYYVHPRISWCALRIHVLKKEIRKSDFLQMYWDLRR